ncbi:MAG TPA: D-2-hydroxyacid dehydrogenase family protein [Hyphomicrobiaceae bacterium]|nr:D-2-hydroxyacid dehydrogenase family protein [Hyphomicrobiaceae bacterium]
MKIAILDDYQGLAKTIADWSRLDKDHDVKVFREHLGVPAEVIAALKDFDVLAITRERTLLDRATLEGLPNLKLIATAGMRNAAIDLECCTERNITVLGTGGSAQATPELAWGLILALARHIPTENARMRDGSWITTLGKDLAGNTLGIIGLGRLGSEMANIGRAFRMNIIAWSQNLTDDAAAKAGAERVAKDELFRRSDFITIHYKLSDRSTGLVGADELALMKPDAYLVNTSRGPIVDTNALVSALKAGRIGGAGIDVYDIEPLPRDHPLRSCPRTVLTPHLGYVSENTYQMFYTEMVEDIESWLAGKPIRVLSA